MKSMQNTRSMIMQSKQGTRKKWRWLHNYKRLRAMRTRAFAHVETQLTTDADCRKIERLLTVIHLSGLLRRSAVVRGAVDTGSRRNHKSSAGDSRRHRVSLPNENSGETENEKTQLIAIRSGRDIDECDVRLRTTRRRDSGRR